jgi:prepilin-type N-terminal cleavage/methylation domain-containing protein
MFLRHRQNGFSLAEVMAVTGLVAIVSAIAIPSLSTLKAQTALPSVQREVMGALYIARASAIAYNSQRSVVITPRTKTIQIKDQSGTTVYTRDLSTYGPSISIAGDGAITIVFDAVGLLSPPTDLITVTINGIANMTKTVTVYGTGKATGS